MDGARCAYGSSILAQRTAFLDKDDGQEVWTRDDDLAAGAIRKGKAADADAEQNNADALRNAERRGGRDFSEDDCREDLPQRDILGECHDFFEKVKWQKAHSYSKSQVAEGTLSECHGWFLWNSSVAEGLGFDPECMAHNREEKVEEEAGGPGSDAREFGW